MLKTLGHKYDFLKIDIQGAEKQILLGAEKFLKSENCVGVLVETYTLQMFENQWLKSEVSQFLACFKFVPVLTFPSHGSFGCSNDVLYIKCGIKSAKLNSILNTYGILRYGDGFYQEEYLFR